MRKPPPQNKAKVTLKEFLDTIPEMNTTSLILSVLWVLRNENRDMVRAGCWGWWTRGDPGLGGSLSGGEPPL